MTKSRFNQLRQLKAERDQLAASLETVRKALEFYAEKSRWSVMDNGNENMNACWFEVDENGYDMALKSLTQITKPARTQSEYREHIRNAADQVKAWPKWKQGEVGVTTPSTTNPSAALRIAELEAELKQREREIGSIWLEHEDITGF